MRAVEASGDGGFGLSDRLMPVFALWSRMALRAAVTLFIAFASLTPALAELGCIEDQASHSQATAAYDEEGHRLESPASGQDGKDAGGNASHCGFSHASHGSAVPPAAGGSLSHDHGRQTFETALARPLAAFARDGPYHPPQA